MLSVKKKPMRFATALLLITATSACSFGLTSPVGPSTSAVMGADKSPRVPDITVIDLGKDANRLHFKQTGESFANTLGESMPVGTTVRPGDTLDVAIWEAPPAALFGSNASGSLGDTGASAFTVSGNASFPGLLVGSNGTIFIPFAGTIPVAGRSTNEIEREITARLKGKAHLPQVIVRIAQNVTSNVTVVGEVAGSRRIPLTPKGERLLDALAQAGGTSRPQNKVMVQITRGNRVTSMPLQSVIRDPRQNIVLVPGDVVSLIFQAYSFTVLGAANRNEEIAFESTGLTLAQAFGRIGGLAPYRAEPKGMFLFRWEDPTNIEVAPEAARDKDGRIPVIYRVNMKDPATYFFAQSFAVRDGDVIYVATSNTSDFQQFIGIIAQTVLPVIAIRNAL